MSVVTRHLAEREERLVLIEGPERGPWMRLNGRLDDCLVNHHHRPSGI